MRSLRRTLAGLLGLGGLALAVLALTPAIATCGGAPDAVTALVRRCAPARARLGDDAHPARLGLACGSTELSGGQGAASWSLPYAGARGRGTITYAAARRGGAWQVERAQLEVEGEAIDLVACAGAADPSFGQTPDDASHGGFSGEVLRSTHPTIAAGARCEGTLDRERGAAVAQLAVRCAIGGAEQTGTAALYQGGARFVLDVRDPARRDDDRVEVDDERASAEDGTPGAKLRLAGDAGTLTVWDAGFEIVIAL